MPTVNSPAPSGPPAPSNASSASGAGPDSGTDGGYPEQRHAGAVGIGPEYGKNNTVTTGEKFEGLKEEAKGKVLHKSDLVQHGKDVRTGEVKRRKQQENDKDPFNTAAGDDNSEKQGDQTPAQDDAPSQQSRAPSSVSASSQRSAPEEKGQYAQASTVAPEGTQAVQEQQQGDHDYHHIG